ncbi:MAG: hypothetical protein JXB30_06115 [Anaerolineae bacterium]|nr:hypothetical protein [Anaerolineae bacterium]
MDEQVNKFSFLARVPYLLLDGITIIPLPARYRLASHSSVGTTIDAEDSTRCTKYD